jgi:hypothetical protein
MSFPSFVNGASMKTWKRIEKTIDEDTTARNMFACNRIELEMEEIEEIRKYSQQTKNQRR